MKKIFIEAFVRDLISQLSKEEITFSRFVELLNEEADKTISVTKMQKINLQNEVDIMTKRLIEAELEKFTTIHNKSNLGRLLKAGSAKQKKL